MTARSSFCIPEDTVSVLFGVLRIQQCNTAILSWSYPLHLSLLLLPDYLSGMLNWKHYFSPQDVLNNSPVFKALYFFCTNLTSQLISSCSPRGIFYLGQTVLNKSCISCLHIFAQSILPTQDSASHGLSLSDPNPSFNSKLFYYIFLTTFSPLRLKPPLNS